MQVQNTWPRCIVTSCQRVEADIADTKLKLLLLLLFESFEAFLTKPPYMRSSGCRLQRFSKAACWQMRKWRIFRKAYKNLRSHARCKRSKQQQQRGLLWRLGQLCRPQRPESGELLMSKAFNTRRCPNACLYVTGSGN